MLYDSSFTSVSPGTQFYVRQATDGTSMVRSDDWSLDGRFKMPNARPVNAAIGGANGLPVTWRVVAFDGGQGD